LPARISRSGTGHRSQKSVLLPLLVLVMTPTLRKQLIVFIAFTALMTAITALSYALTATTDGSDCLRGSVDHAEACPP